MELLYAWIEDYNNIYRQGFNFSPKHKFEFKPTDFDEKGNVIGGTLTHDDINTNYPNNFFGKSISNITAIVGMNGSGKSSLVSALLENGKKIIVSMSNNEIILYSNKIKVEHRYKETNIIDDRFVYYSTSVNSNQIDRSIDQNAGDSENDLFLSVLGGDDDDDSSYIDISTNYFICNAAKDFNDENQEEWKIIGYGSQYFSFLINEKIRQVKSMRLLKKIGCEFIPDFFSVRIKLNELSIGDIDANIYDEDFLGNSWDYDFAENICKSLLIAVLNNDLYKGISPKDADEHKREIIDLLKDEHNRGNCYAEMLEKVMLRLYNSGDAVGFYLKLVSHFTSFIEKYGDVSIESDWISVQIFCDDFIDYGVNLELFVSSDLSFLLSLKLEWRNMSDGEVELLTLYSRLIPQMTSFSKIIILDEPDVRLHPAWQKCLTNRLMWLFSEVSDIKHHLILTTHSPILLSDLPRENIIFLDKDADGKCVVKEPEDMDRTFGANIHNLYRSSFFMQEGLMGEFAKGKIDGVIKDLNGGFDTVEEESKETRKNEMDYIIGQIGEPVIQGMLRKKYNDKFHSNGSLNERILKLEEELAYLKMKSNDSN